MGNKICPNCGKEVPLDAAECPECGHVFEEQKQTANNKPKKEDKKQCPYCGSSELIEIGVGAFMCPACRNRVLIPSGEFAPLPDSFNFDLSSAGNSGNNSKGKKEKVRHEKEHKPYKPSKLVFAFGIIGWLFLLAAFIQMLTSPGLQTAYKGRWGPFYRYIYPSELMFGGGISDGMYDNAYPIHSSLALVAWICTMISLGLMTVLLVTHFIRARAMVNISIAFHFITALLSVVGGVMVLAMPGQVNTFADNTYSLYITWILSAVFLLLAGVIALIGAIVKLAKK